MEIMGLNFAAFDFALDYEANGTFSNASQWSWLWLEMLRGLPMVDVLYATFGPHRHVLRGVRIIVLGASAPVRLVIAENRPIST